VGGGGHSRLILEAAPDVQVAAVDRDEQASQQPRTIWANGDRVQFFLSNFADYEPDNVSFDGVVADLGVSSYHLDASERGFSFRKLSWARYANGWAAIVDCS